MDDHLERLVRSLRREKCPDSVGEAVARRIAREGQTRRPRWALIRWATTGGLALGLVVACSFLIRRDRFVPEVAVASAVAKVEVQSDRAVVIQQTHEALAIVGQALIHAASHAGDVLREDAAPPLLKSFLSAKTKITETL